MKLVALVKAPQDPAAAAAVLAAATGATLAEVRMRLAAEPPCLLARLEEGPADELVAKLRGAGLAALACGLPVPTDAERTVARGFELGPTSITFTPRSGEPLRLPYADILLVLRGLRLSSQTTTRSETRKKFSLGAAVLTQGLKTSVTTRRDVTTVDEESQHFVLAYDGYGRCGAIYDSEAAFACLGPKLASSKLGNILAVHGELKQQTPHALHDERLLRLARRTLPFVVPKEQHGSSGTVSTVHADGSTAVDVLSELLFRAALEGLLR